MLQIKKGATDRSVDVLIIDSADGTPETGVVFNTAGIDLWYRRDGAALVSITEATLAALTTAHTDGGFLAIGNGVYRLDLPDAAFATGANKVSWGGTVTGMIVIGGEAMLVDYDPQDTVRLGLTALPNAAAAAAGGLPISAAGALDLDAQRADVAAILVDTGTTLDGKVDAIDNFIDTEVAAIKAVTDVLPLPLWSGILDAVAAGTVEFPPGYGISTQAQIVVEITSAGAHFGKSRFAIYSGTGDVWNVDKAWNADGETTPTGTPTARAFSVPANPATNLSPVDVVNWKGATAPAMTGDAFARLGAPAGASIAADLLVIDNLVDDLETRLTAARAGYLDNLSAGAVAQASALSTVAGYLDTEVAAILAIANKIDTALELDGAVYRFTVNALELAPTGGSAPTAAAIRAEIDANSTQLAALVTAVDAVPTNAELATALGTADDAVLAAIAALNNLSQANIRTALGMASANLDTQLAAIDDAVDTEIAAIVTNVGTLLTNVATILAAVDTEVAAIKTKTDLLPAAPAATGDIPTAVQVADALLGRNIAGGSSTGRTVTSALRRLRNKVAIAAGTMTVYQEDDTTSDHTAAVTTAAGNPIVSVDPV